MSGSGLAPGGVAGDVYTHTNGTANLGLWRQLEALGCDVWPAPLLVDNMDFGLPDEVGRSLRAGQYLKARVAGLLSVRKDWTAWPLRRRFGRLLDRPDEPDHARVIDLASRYIGPRSRQLLLLSVAKIVDFARRGADGVRVRDRLQSLDRAAGGGQGYGSGRMEGDPCGGPGAHAGLSRGRGVG